MIRRLLRWCRRRRTTSAVVIARVSERFAAYVPVPYNPHPGQKMFRFAREANDARP